MLGTFYNSQKTFYLKKISHFTTNQFDKIFFVTIRSLMAIRKKFGIKVSLVL